MSKKSYLCGMQYANVQPGKDGTKIAANNNMTTKQTNQTNKEAHMKTLVQKLVSGLSVKLADDLKVEVLGEGTYEMLVRDLPCAYVTCKILSDEVRVRAEYSEGFRQAAKANGGSWDGVAWVFPIEMREVVEKLVRKYYGYALEWLLEQRPALFDVVLSKLPSDKPFVKTTARLIATRPARDAQVKMGPCCYLVDGEFARSGGSQKYPMLGPNDAKVLAKALTAEDIAELASQGVEIEIKAVSIAEGAYPQEDTTSVAVSENEQQAPTENAEANSIVSENVQPVPGLAREGDDLVVVDKEAFKQYALSNNLFAITLNTPSRWGDAVNKLGLENFLVIRNGSDVIAYVTPSQVLQIRNAI